MVSDVSKVSGNLSVYIFGEILFPFGGRTGILPDLGGFQNLAAVQCSAVQCSAVQCSAVRLRSAVGGAKARVGSLELH
jgi:hypothetical protein